MCIACFNYKRRKLYARMPEQEGRTEPPPQPLRTKAPKSKTYVITYAQNATPVHPAFLASLLRYCEERKATLLVLPGRYKNPTSIFSQGMASEDWWDTALHPYLFAGRMNLGKNLTVYGDISIQPTADRPLTGFEAFTGVSSAIFGHPKLQLTTVATGHDYPRILTTTGAVTRPNYTNTKAGKKAGFHHILGATVVEQGENLFHLRQINALDDGSFIDLDREYTVDGSNEAKRALALYCGDIHDAHADAEVIDATFTAPSSIVNILRPEKIIYSDVLDFDARNHHTIGDFCDRYARARNERGDSVEEECRSAISFLDDLTPEDAEPVVIASNHDEAFDRWLNEANPKQDPLNAKFYHQMWLAKIDAYEEYSVWIPAFELFYAVHGKNRARFLARDEAYRIGGILVSCHGDEGPNGAIGTRLGFARMGAKTMIGHGHSPGILDGCMQVGVTGKRDQGYNNPMLSSWLNSHGVIYANKKRTLINVIAGSWRGGSA